MRGSFWCLQPALEQSRSATSVDEAHSKQHLHLFPDCNDQFYSPKQIVENLNYYVVMWGRRFEGLSGVTRASFRRGAV